MSEPREALRASLKNCSPGREMTLQLLTYQSSPQSPTRQSCYVCFSCKLTNGYKRLQLYLKTFHSFITYVPLKNKLEETYTKICITSKNIEINILYTKMK